MNTATTGSGLTAGQRTRLQASLEQRRDELDRRLDALQGGQSRVDHAAEFLAQDGDDAPQRDADREVDLARNDWTLRALGEVSRALARVHDADYGLCADCGESIRFDRLLAEPWTPRCVGCQAQAERR
jgi:DnaK suppressor protein